MRGTVFGERIRAVAAGVPIVWDAIDCLGDLLRPFAGASVAFDVSSTTYEAFSVEPEGKHATTVGPAFSLGTWFELGPGALLFEAQYRHIEPNTGKFSKFAPAMLSNVSLHLGYGFGFGGIDRS